jgi:CRP-like cAMP-binding protein
LDESILISAFLMGIISASSLPLGAVTASIWRPGDRLIAILMAFGGGALLAALTIDLVASTVDEGHFHALAIGAILGGLLFIGLNQVVNDYGGFLRKVSTTIYYLRRKQYRQIQQIASRINRVDLFKELPGRDFKMIAPAVQIRKYRKGESVYRKGDPAELFFIIAEGEVEIFDPSPGAQAPEHLGRFDLFGWKACLTSTPYAVTASAKTELTLWSIPKRCIDNLLLNSPQFQQLIHLLLRNDNLVEYLHQYHRLDRQAAETWAGKAAQSLVKRGMVPPALEVTRNVDTFLRRIQLIQRFPLIQGLPDEEMQLLCQYLIYKTYRRGETFFLQGSAADRMFFIEQGEVNLIDPERPLRKSLVLHDNEAFGGLSMLTGAKCSVTALAAEDTTVWELRRLDLETILTRAPEFTERFRDFIQQGKAIDYLQSKHLNVDQATQWTRKALHSLQVGGPLPHASDIALEIQENKGAPLAIWLGITLDGIPESLVIGASMIHSHISLSLIAGLFLSNYPEALSSSTGMRQQGFSFIRVLLMWSSLMLFTGLGAALGSHFFVNASPDSFALVQGIAAGAMLTMIAETMLPEAYFKGGSVVGMSTLMGFLVAIFFKTLEVA